MVRTLRRKAIVVVYTMTERYYSEQPIVGSSVRLSGPEAHHLIHVMRGSAGQEVILFDGSGAEFLCQIRQIARTEVQLQVIERRWVNRELPCQLSVACCLPKRDRQRWLVEKCVELGVGRMIPLITERTVVRPSERTLTRLRRVVIEASKQCGRNRLMPVADPIQWAELTAVSNCVQHQIMAHPAEPNRTPGGAAQSAVTAVLHCLEPGDAVLVAVGPEGGFTEDEVRAGKEAGWEVVDLGPRILRTETAAVVLAALVAASM